MQTKAKMSRPTMESISPISKSIYPRAPAFLKRPLTASIVGAPISLGQRLVGVENGPDFIRDLSLRDSLQNEGWRVDDQGNISIPEEDGVGDHPDARNSQAVGAANEILAHSVRDNLSDGRFSLVLGGDHSVGIGSIAGVLMNNPDVGVIWVDAHADINTPETSGSKNIHGMCLSFLSGLVDPTTISGFEWLKDVPNFDLSRLVYIGLRDVDSGERKIIKDHNIKAYSMASIDRHGIGQVTKMALDYLVDQKKCENLHLSFDIDAVDPINAPSTGTAVRGGLSFRESHLICEEIHDTGLLSSMDLVEVNPNLAPGEKADATADMGKSLILSAMGERLL